MKTSDINTAILEACTHGSTFITLRSKIRTDQNTLRIHLNALVDKGKITTEITDRGKRYKTKEIKK